MSLPPSATPQKISGDWYDGDIPGNVVLDPDSHIDSSYSFVRFRSLMQPALTLGRGAAVYTGTRFDVGPRGHVEVGAFAMLNGVEIICDDRIRIGAYALISWNVVLMDSYRVPRSASVRRHFLQALIDQADLRTDLLEPPKAIDVGENVWIGHDVVVLPGVTIGVGSVVGARSVVVDSIPDYSIAAGNPARVIRRFEENA